MSIQITDANIDEITSTGISVVDFWAAWCGPCRMLGPVIDELSKDNPDIKVGKLNVDENPNSAVKYGIRSIPAIIFFKDGVPVDRLVGVQSKANYQAKLNSLK